MMTFPLLTIGRLSEVKHLTVTVSTNFTIFIDWVAPFSLDITQTSMAEMGVLGVISYCVEVQKRSSREPLVSECGLVDTHYSYSWRDVMPPSPCDSMDVVITPANSAGNGSSSILRRAFYNGMCMNPLNKDTCFPGSVLGLAW
jgi:hypothetical protein